MSREALEYNLFNVSWYKKSPGLLARNIIIDFNPIHPKPLLVKSVVWCSPHQESIYHGNRSLTRGEVQSTTGSASLSSTECIYSEYLALSIDRTPVFFCQ